MTIDTKQLRELAEAAGHGNVMITVASLKMLLDRLEAAERDARRYRWIRSAPRGTIRLDLIPAVPMYVNWNEATQLDAAIDAQEKGE